MDLQSVTEELYGLHPQDFTAARGRHVAAARTAGDRALARQIQTLRRPTLSAWASNLLVRARPDEVTSLLALGEGLRQAHRDLDGGQLRELSRQQHVVVSALAREARKLAAEAAGHPVSEEVQREVAETLHAALADPQAAQQWAAGRLPKPLAAPVGFTPAEGGASPAPAPSLRERPGTEKGGGAHTREQEAERRRRLADAREEARAAQEEADAREGELRQAEADSEEAAALLREAERQRADLARRLETAEQREETARAAAHRAQTQAEAAARAADQARRRAGEAAARVERSV
ncbi:hypothetical protein AB0K71_17745 [Streptomyces syringium]|uniref:hypothetical protein n=1 Tax=Streptomyces syringium TaxID=76729 RepID=UPI00342A2C48